MAVIQRFASAAAVLAAQAKTALRNYGTALLWAGAVFALVAGIFACLGSAACHEAVPQVIEETDEIAEGAVEAGVEIVVLVIKELGSLTDPDPAPDPETKQAPEAPLPPAPDPDPDRNDRDCKINPRYRSWNFRSNLVCLSGQNWPRSVKEAHHIFVKAYQVRFDAILGPFQIHDPHFGAWWPTADHQHQKGRYQARWTRYLAQFSSYGPWLYGETLQEGKDIMRDFGFGTSDLYF